MKRRLRLPEAFWMQLRAFTPIAAWCAVVEAILMDTDQ